MAAIIPTLHIFVKEIFYSKLTQTAQNNTKAEYALTLEVVCIYVCDTVAPPGHTISRCYIASISLFLDFSIPIAR